MKLEAGLKVYMCSIYDEGWMTSWGGYLGAVISSAIAFVILYIQRRDNEKQNEDNRQLQLNILIYQQERARLDKIVLDKYKNICYNNYRK